MKEFYKDKIRPISKYSKNIFMGITSGHFTDEDGKPVGHIIMTACTYRGIPVNVICQEVKDKDGSLSTFPLAIMVDNNPFILDELRDIDGDTVNASEDDMEDLR